MRTRPRWLLFVGLLPSTLLSTQSLAAQRVSVLTVNDRLRVWAPPRSEGHEGTLLAIDTTAARTLIWRRPARRGADQAVVQISDTTPLAAIQRLEVYRQRAGGRRVGEGMLLGLLVGAAGGALVGGAADCDNGDSMCGLSTLIGAAGGGVLGGLVGGIVGSFVRSPPVGSWEPVAVPRSVGVTPVRRGVVLSVRL
jgi:hypothetical protein